MPPMAPRTLETRWRALWQQRGASAPPVGWFDKLIAAWTEPHRHYHTLEHLQESLALFDEVSVLAEHPADVELALWFHDAVYDPGDENNELKSAYLAERAMTIAGSTKDEIGTIRRMILATRHHGRAETPDEALLLDLDLAILGSIPARFDRYEDDIRKEFFAVPWAQYLAGRRRVLRGFQDRERIYRTDHFHGRFDQAARVNLARSLKRLPPLRGLAG